MAGLPNRQHLRRDTVLDILGCACIRQHLLPSIRHHVFRAPRNRLALLYRAVRLCLYIRAHVDLMGSGS
jgi:hypothetical protein